MKSFVNHETQQSTKDSIQKDDKDKELGIDKEAKNISPPLVVTTSQIDIESEKTDSSPVISDKKLSPEKEATTAILNKHFEDRTTALQSVFTKHAEKEAGITDGYIGRRVSDNQIFMIKTAEKFPPFKTSSISKDESSLYLVSPTFVNEFITAGLYKRVLYDRAPIIEGIKEDKSSSNFVYLSSKFLHKFQNLREFIKTHGHNKQKNRNPLEQVQGAEKLFAAILFGGEGDIHNENIGIMKEKNAKGEEVYVFAKIDHGMSGFQFFSDPKMMMANLASVYKEYGYSKEININISKFKEAIDQISKITDEEIETIVKSRVEKLRLVIGEIKDFKLTWFENLPRRDFLYESKSHLREKTFNSFKELEEHYINNYKTQRITFRELSKNLDQIERIEHPVQNWKNGQWLTDIADKDPITWAAENRLKISTEKPNFPEIDTTQSSLEVTLEQEETKDIAKPLQGTIDSWEALQALSLIEEPNPKEIDKEAQINSWEALKDLQEIQPDISEVSPKEKEKTNVRLNSTRLFSHSPTKHSTDITTNIDQGSTPKPSK